MLSPLARTIAHLRTRLCLSQAALAAVVDVPRGLIARWECGDRPVPPQYLAPLAVGLGISADLDLRPLQALSVEAGCALAGAPRAVDCPEEPPYDNSNATLEDMLRLGGTARFLHEQGLERLGRVLYAHFCEVFPRDRAYELLGAHHAVADGAVPTWLSPLHLGCPLLVVPHGGMFLYTGHRARPALVWTRGQETLVLFGQVTIAAVLQSRRYRVDLLAMYRGGGERAHWVYVEFDGGYHQEIATQDARRAAGIGAMEIRFDNGALQSLDFFGRRLLPQVRGKAAWAEKAAGQDAHRKV